MSVSVAGQEVMQQGSHRKVNASPNEVELTALMQWNSCSGLFPSSESHWDQFQLIAALLPSHFTIMIDLQTCKMLPFYNKSFKVVRHWGRGLGAIPVRTSSLLLAQSSLWLTRLVSPFAAVFWCWGIWELGGTRNPSSKFYNCATTTCLFCMHITYKTQSQETHGFSASLLPILPSFHSWPYIIVRYHSRCVHMICCLKLLPSKLKVQHKIPDSPDLSSGSVTAVHLPAWTCRSSPSSEFSGVRRCPTGTYCTCVCREILN